MKVITSIDEWLEAAENNRLMYLSSVSGWGRSEYSGNSRPAARISLIARNLKEKLYGVAPEEVKLVEYAVAGSLLRCYLHEDREPESHWPWQKTGRTLTGVIDSE